MRATTRYLPHRPLGYRAALGRDATPRAAFARPAHRTDLLGEHAPFSIPPRAFTAPTADPRSSPSPLPKTNRSVGSGHGTRVQRRGRSRAGGPTLVRHEGCGRTHRGGVRKRDRGQSGGHRRDRGGQSRAAADRHGAPFVPACSPRRYFWISPGTFIPRRRLSFRRPSRSCLSTLARVRRFRRPSRSWLVQIP